MTESRGSLSLTSGLLLLAGWLALAGCAGKFERRELVIPHNTWIGRTVPDVEAVFGEPDARQPDGAGGEVLLYQDLGTEAVRIHALVSDNPHSGYVLLPGGGVARSPDVAQPSGSMVEIPAVVAKAKFWTDADDIVYRYWLDPESYNLRRGLPSPHADER